MVKRSITPSPKFFTISKIIIRNFRSIDRQEIDGNWVTSFVGQNDAGKSNVLRALNLFFNGETDIGETFNFDRDFNKFVKTPIKKAPQIEIEIYFSLPPSFQRKNYPNEVKWKKIWRSGGLITNLENRRYTNGAIFPSYSKIPVLLDRVRYNYIPAIKDPTFFARLQGALYKVLASVAEKDIRSSALDFERGIQTHIGELLLSLDDILSTESTMRLPDDLTQIFENLEFASDGIPLSRRGDGIKIRYIPKILRFMAEKENSILGPGSSKYFHVWGFEEPENNVEMSAAFKMVNQILQMLEESDRFQIFLTTHSPIFYGMIDPGVKNGDPWVTNYFVEKIKKETLISKRDRNHVDQTMGLMPLVAPYIEEARTKYDALEREQKQLLDVAERRCPTVFLEGKTDKAILERSIKLYAPDAVDHIHLHVGNTGEYGSANALASRALAWILEMRHRPDHDKVLALALFDSDEAGKTAKKELMENIKKINIKTQNRSLVAKSISPSANVLGLLQKGFKIPLDIESLYTNSLWSKARNQGWLVDVDSPQDRLSKNQVTDLLRSKIDPYADLSDDEQMRVDMTFSDDGKIKASKYIAKLRDKNAQRELVNFKGLIQEIVATLLPT
jgi:hypothetical protein